MIWIQVIIDWLNIFGNGFKNEQSDITKVNTVKYRSR